MPRGGFLIVEAESRELCPEDGRVVGEGVAFIRREAVEDASDLLNMRPKFGEQLFAAR